MSMRKSCDVTFIIKTLRKHIEGRRIDLLNFDWNQRIMLAGIHGFTQCFDDEWDVTRFPHSVVASSHGFAEDFSTSIYDSDL